MLAHRLTYPVYVRPWLRRQFCAFAEDRKRKDLAKYITLVESTLPQHQQEAKKLMKVVLEKRKQSNINDSIRIGISGSPGVGKSTFIESFGLSLIERGHRVAVLAVDPSSTRGGGGSILGDKTRMTNLSLHENAYIRPSPSRGNLGGVARNTMESILLCEEFGYDIETVGVGQSEVEVEGIVDFYLLLVQPASGDELQGIKKGVVEVADLIVVTKADGDLAKRSSMTQYEYMNAIKFMTPKLSHWFPRVLKCSSTTGAGIPEIIDTVKEFRRCGTETGFIGQHRGEQLEDWMWRIIFEETKRSFLNDSSVIHSLPKTLEKVRSEEYFPWDSANYLLDIYFNHLKKKKGEELE